METLATVLARWWDHAACRGMDLNLFIFEPGERYSRKKIAEAKAVCATCIVRPSCLAESLKYSTTQLECYGIWGGLTWKERRQLQSDTNLATPLVYRDGKYRQIREPRP
jgi:WhiB family redox-sensing transcriptional regulator